MDGDGGGAVEGLVEDEGCGEGGDCVKVQVEVEHPHGGLHCLGIASAAQTDAYIVRHPTVHGSNLQVTNFSEIAKTEILALRVPLSTVAAGKRDSPGPV